MAERLTDRPTLVTSADGDLIHIVDVSDVTDSAQGTSKQITKANLFSGFGGGGGTTNAGDLTSGVLLDARVQQSNVTQHQAALVVSSGQVTGLTEAAQDAVGDMFIANIENGIAVTYDDVANKVNFNVNDPVITLSGDLTGSAIMTNLGDVTISAQVANDSHTHDTRYFTEAESDARFAAVSHVHTIANVTTLQASLDAKLGLTAKAQDSELLDGLDSTAFARKDQANTFTEEVAAPSFRTDSWTIDQSGTDLVFNHNGVTKFTIDLNGNIIATGNVTAT
jgi:hypothetical protein